MTHFALLIYGDQDAGNALSDDERKAMMDEWWAYEAWLGEKGWKHAGEALEDTPTAKTVRSGIVTDGPFAETKEQLGGFYVLACTEAEALEAAEQCPGSRFGAVEVRPVIDFSQYQ
jgi:hypothetical protein